MFRTSLPVGLALALASAVSAQDDPTLAPELLVASHRPLALDYALDSEVRLTRPVEVRIDLLAETADAGHGLLRVPLFGGETIDVRYESSADTPQGGFTWVGQVVGDPHGDLCVAVHGDKVAASIRTGHELLRISPGSNGVHGLVLVDEDHFPPCGTDHTHEVHLPDNPVDNAAGGQLYADVLVAYSPQARSANGGTNGMLSLINLAVLETNQGYDQSDVAHDLRLVHTLETIQGETNDMGQVLSRVTAKNDGWYDEVHPARDLYGADFVAMIVASGQYCGIAYLMTNVSPGFEDNAFSVTADGCATGNYTFGHELGHNMGSHHDRDNAGNAAYPYSYGYRTPNNQYRTILAYSPGQRIKYFSNPDVTFNGWALGIAHPDPDSADNARSLDTAAPTFTEFRPEPNGPQVLFSENFESGDFTAGGWTISHPDRCKVNKKSARTGNYGGRLKKGGVGTGSCTVGTEESWIETPSIDTVGYSSVEISLSAHFRQNEIGCEFLDLQWWNGVSWESYATVETHAWDVYSFDLPAGAAGNPDLRLRFQTNAKGKKERAELDDLVVIGTP